MSRRFNAGEYFNVSGIEFRVEQGRKHPDDRVLLWWSQEYGWKPIEMTVGFLLADFFFENEEVLYPKPAKGGDYYLDACEVAARNGWRQADEQLKAAKVRAAERRRNVA